MDDVTKKRTVPLNLLRLPGVINAANRETDDEAGALIDRVRKNKRRTLDLITKGHKNESMRELMLSEAEKEQALADLAAAVGDNGGPLEDEEADTMARDELRKAKLPSSTSSETKQEQEASQAASGTFQPA